MPWDSEREMEIDRLAKSYTDELVALRRDLHAHPEPGREEVRTTRLVAERLEAAGLRPTTLPAGTGLLCDVRATAPQATMATEPATRPRPRIALRADLDALRVDDEKDVEYRSTRPGACHACGHDVHTTVVLGAGLALAELAAAGRLDTDVLLIFQPAEELIPGGALDVMAAGGLTGVEQILSLHCDPHFDVGTVGLRTGPLTAATDRVHARLTGPGGHTARPQLSADLVYALGALITELPAALSRRVDPRAGLSLVWGRAQAGAAANAIPMGGEIEGTLRCLDADAWHACGDLVPELARPIVERFGVGLDIDVHRGVPPVVNTTGATETLRRATESMFGEDAVAHAEQSMGGEDFAWYLTEVPGAMARLGVRTPGTTAPADLHQPIFDVDEHAIAVGVRLLVASAVLAGTC